MATKRRTVRVDDETWQAFAEACDADAVSMSERIVTFIRSVIDEHRARLEGSKTT